MQLVEQVFHAHGGAHRWQSVTRFTAHVSISGGLLPVPSRRPPLVTPHRVVSRSPLIAAPNNRPMQRELVIEGGARHPSVRMYDATDMNRYGTYSPTRAEFRDLSDTLLDAKDEPAGVLSARRDGTPLEALDQAYLYGAMIWSTVVGPFALTCGGIVSKEPEPRAAKGGPFRVLRAELPREVDPITPLRHMFIDDQGLIRWIEYTDPAFHGGIVVDSLSAYCLFDGIRLPTLRRIQAQQPDGTLAPAPLLDIEIFDVQFS